MGAWSDSIRDLANSGFRSAALSQVGTAVRPAHAQKVSALVHGQSTQAADLVEQVAFTFQLQRFAFRQLCLFALHLMFFPALPAPPGHAHNMKSKSIVVTGAPCSAAAALPIKTASSRHSARASAILSNNGAPFTLMKLEIRSQCRNLWLEHDFSA